MFFIALITHNILSTAAECRVPDFSSAEFESFQDSVIKNSVAVDVFTGVGEMTIKGLKSPAHRKAGRMFMNIVFPILTSHITEAISPGIDADPNDEKFKLMGKALDCLIEENAQQWKAIKEIHSRIDELEEMIQHRFLGSLIDDLKHLNLLSSLYMKKIKFCTIIDDITFDNNGNVCGISDLEDMLYNLADIGFKLSNTIEKTMTEMSGRVERENLILLGKKQVISDLSNTYFVTPPGQQRNDFYYLEIKERYSYTGTRMFLSELIAQGYILLILLEELKTWAVNRNLHRNSYVSEILWSTISNMADVLKDSFDIFIKLLTDPVSGVDNRIMTSDHFQPRVFCTNYLRLKVDAPDWCLDKQPEGWDDNIPEKRQKAPSGHTRGCWIGDGDCNIENLLNYCVDQDSYDIGGDLEKYCRINDIPNLSIDEEHFDEVGPISWIMYKRGAPVDPILEQIHDMQELSELALVFKKAWMNEWIVKYIFITPDCAGKTELLSGKYSFDVCPEPSEIKPDKIETVSSNSAVQFVTGKFVEDVTVSMMIKGHGGRIGGVIPNGLRNYGCLFHSNGPEVFLYDNGDILFFYNRSRNHEGWLIKNAVPNPEMKSTRLLQFGKRGNEVFVQVADKEFKKSMALNSVDMKGDNSKVTIGGHPNDMRFQSANLHMSKISITPPLPVQTISRISVNSAIKLVIDRLGDTVLVSMIIKGNGGRIGGIIPHGFRDYGCLFTISGGPELFIYDNGDIRFFYNRGKNKDPWLIKNAVPNPEEKITRRLQFGKVGNELFLTIGAEQYREDIGCTYSGSTKHTVTIGGHPGDMRFQSVNLFISNVIIRSANENTQCE